MKNTLTMWVVACGACFALLGCASEQRRLAGFLPDGFVLEPHPIIEGRLIHWNRGIDLEHLRPVPVETVEVHFVDRNEVNLAKPDDVAVFRAFSTEELIAAIGKHATIATEPEPDEESKRRDAYAASNRPARGH